MQILMEGKIPSGLVKKTTVYGHVSSHDQKKKDDLDKQLSTIKDYCKEQGDKNIIVFKDVGNGLNVKGKGLKRLCQAIEHRTIDKVKNKKKTSLDLLVVIISIRWNFNDEKVKSDFIY